MQRCPTCDFVYEEGQQLCDMDGTQLVHDPHELPANQLVVRPKRRTKSVFRLVTMVALPNCLLAALLFYGTTRQEAQTSTEVVLPSASKAHPNIPPISPTDSPAAITAAPTPSEAPPPKPTGVDSTSPSGSDAKGLEPVANPGVEPAKPAPVRGEPKPSTSRTAAPKPTTQKATVPKKDSKVSSLIKKTTRFLKRPFKD